MVGKKSRDRKPSKEQKNPTTNEKQALLNKNTYGVNSNGQEKVVLKRMESKIITAAPLASETVFEDVPVLTICPYCDQKIVTKTHFDKKKTICFCCCVCHPTLAFIFKDVIHSCPKCNIEITTYNRFLFCFRGFSSRKLDRYTKRSPKSLNGTKTFDYDLLEEPTNISSVETDTNNKDTQQQINDPTMTELKIFPIDENKNHIGEHATQDGWKTDSTSSTVEEIETDSTSPDKNNGKINSKLKKKKRRFSLPKRKKSP